MKRDMELVRTILLTLAAVPEGQRIPHPLVIDGHSEQAVGHHVSMMGQAGLLEVADITAMNNVCSQALPLEITWAGHDFIDTMRSQEVWEQTKQAMKDAGGGGFSMMLEFGKKVADGFMKKKLKDLTGLEI